MTNVDIRPISSAFETQIRALAKTTHQEHAARLPHIFHGEGGFHQELLDVFFDAESQNNFHAFVALRGDALAGYVLVVPDPDRPNNAWIVDICVVDEFRQQGVATSLLAHCGEEKERLGWESLSAQVWLGNDASHQLFMTAGYLAERTDYRLGQPSKRDISLGKPPQNRRLILSCLLLATALLAYLMR